MSLRSVVPVILALCTTACLDPGGSKGGTASDPLHPRWLADAWFHDDGREGYATYADYYITLGDDGQGSFYDDNGNYDFSGGWQLDGETLTVGDYTLGITWTPNCAVIAAEGKVYIGTIDRERLDCPTEIEPLDDLEACLVGKWSSYSADGYITTSQSWTFGNDRSYVELYDNSGYTSGGSAYSQEGQWSLTPTGDIEILYPGGDSEVRGHISAFVGRSRDGDLDSRCDRAAFDGSEVGDESTGGWESSGGWDSSGGDSTGWGSSGWDTTGWGSSGWGSSGWDTGEGTTGVDGPENTPAACDDDYDNDQDGYTDCGATYPDFDCCGVGSCGCTGWCEGQGLCG